MMEMSVAFEAFHFLRPLWLLTLLPLLALWWTVRRDQVRPPPTTPGLAPHLRIALTVGGGRRRRIQPIDGVALALTFLALGAAGPTWSRHPGPFSAQSAPLVIALKVTVSMEKTDVAPSRLERAKQKIRDLLELRAGTRTALIAYAGSAHVAVPMTDDPGVMLPYLEGLTPEVMPSDGNRAAEALARALELLTREADPGGVLFVTDSIDPADTPTLSDPAARTTVLVMGQDSMADRGISALSGIPVIASSTDSSDVARIDRMLTVAQARAALAESDQPWQDRGLLLVWPAALLSLLWFRRGWTMRWGALALLVITLPVPNAHADGLTGLFFTPDQQGRLAFERKEFQRAANIFEDPLWRGYALYRDGQYTTAVAVLDRVETAQAAFIQGMAHMKSRGYRDGVRAFQTALARDSDYPGAAENLIVAEQIVAYVERARDQSDTGEDRGIGADDVVFDNEANRGTETQIEVQQDSGTPMLTTEQWMRTVDTRTGDFLKSRFALEAAQGIEPDRTVPEAGK